MKKRSIMIVVVAIALISVSISCSTATWLRKTAVTETPIPSPQPEPTSREPSAMPVRSREVLILEGNLANLYQRVNPGVVTIWRYDTTGSANEDSFPTGQGSGFVIDLDGHIVTNQHVIAGANEIEVDFPSGLKPGPIWLAQTPMQTWQYSRSTCLKKSWCHYSSVTRTKF